jgi:hypothetical protein
MQFSSSLQAIRLSFYSVAVTSKPLLLALEIADPSMIVRQVHALQ